MELYLKRGIENLKFGMTDFQCREILGMPDREVVDSDNEDINIIEYFDLKLRLSFYLDENNRFGYLRCANPELSFSGHKLIDAKIQFVKDVIFGEEEMNWEIEEYDFFHTHFNKKNWLTLHVEYGVVTEVELGVPLINDNHVWPL